MNTHDFKSENKIVHEYTITVDMNKNGHEVTTLFRSHEETWSEDNRGEELFNLIDTGDMIIFPKKMFAGDVDYAAFAELYIMMAFINKTEHMPLYQGTIEQVSPTKSINI